MTRSGRGPRQPGGGRQTAGRAIRSAKAGQSSRKIQAWPRRESSSAREAKRSGGEGRRTSASRGGGSSAASSATPNLSRPLAEFAGGGERPPPFRPDFRDDGAIALPTSVQTVAVTPDESACASIVFSRRGSRASPSATSSASRKGEVRVNGKRAEPSSGSKPARRSASRRSSSTPPSRARRRPRPMRRPANS